jgi:hypothetical protein
MYDIAEITHYALAVPDIDEAMERLGATLGYEWRPVQEWDIPVLAGDRRYDTTAKFTYSTGGPPFLELIQGEPGTIWDPGVQGIHHVGVWTDDLAADIAALERDGLPIEACGRGSDGKPDFWSYHRTSDGLRVELVDGSTKEAFERWRSGGDLE